MVPGPDGKFGWGGHCFPKDTAAIVSTAKSVGIDLETLEAAISSNKKFRN
jgi:UDP-glucose 6-dehydrogenase